MPSFSSSLSSLEETSSFGQQVLADGTRLLGHVPHLAPEAYFHEIFPPLPAAELNTLQAQIGTPLPAAFLQLLSLANGLILFSASFYLYGLQGELQRSGTERKPFDLVSKNRYERPANLPKSAIVIGGYKKDPGYSLYGSGSSPAIHLSARKDATSLRSWPTLEDMLATEIARLMPYYDSMGRLLRPTATRPLFDAAPPPVLVTDAV